LGAWFDTAGREGQGEDVPGDSGLPPPPPRETLAPWLGAVATRASLGAPTMPDHTRREGDVRAAGGGRTTTSAERGEGERVRHTSGWGRGVVLRDRLCGRGGIGEREGHTWGVCGMTQQLPRYP